MLLSDKLAKHASNNVIALFSSSNALLTVCYNDSRKGGGG